MTQYEGKHSVLFLSDSDLATLRSSGYKTRHVHSWEDWYLIPSSRPVVAMPKIQTKAVEIPGLNGSIDLTEVLTGNPVYNNRTGSLDFIVDNEHVAWTTELQNIAATMHGRKMNMILLDDMEFYYTGRFSVNQWKSEANRSSIVLNYDVGPFKWSLLSSDEDWLWDPFNFETGFIRTIKNREVSGTLDVICPNGAWTPTPVITLSAAMTVYHTNTGTTYSLPAGQSSQITLVSGDNILRFTGNGTVTMSYRGGYL